MSKGRVASILGIIIGCAFVALGAMAIVFAMSLSAPPEPDVEPDPPAPIELPTPAEPAALEPKEFSDYTWDELIRIAERMEAAPDEVTALGIAREYLLIDEEGRPSAQAHELELDNGLVVSVRLVGVLHDTRADTGRKAALTFLASPIDVRSVNVEATCDGGWKDSLLRAWLNDEGMRLFPDNLASSIAVVEKMANTVGMTSNVDDIAPVEDALWLFSCREVCGEITWIDDEFGYMEDGEDAILNAEGTQYEAFAQAGVTQRSDSNGFLVMSYRGEEVAWWYRTPYAFEYIEQDDDAFYQVTSFGYVSAVNLASEKAGIVVGFCL